MKKFSFIPLLLATLLLAPQAANAQDRIVVGGQTSVLLNGDTLDAAGLAVSGISGDVIAPGELGAASVAFGINSRSGNLPTTFAYTSGTLAPFSGTIEHTGSVFFNNDTIEVGNFTIGFDGSRASGNVSGFFVESTVGLQAILFDIENPDSVMADPNALSIAANLLVSPEFASVLGNSAFTGANGGQALVSASAIPEPTSVMLLMGGCVTLMLRRRKI